MTRTETSAARRWVYVPELDALRALAIVAVMLHHFVPDTFGGGYFGVTVFFVLSGYLITGLLLSEWDRHGAIDLPAFYARRVLRLYPALIAVVLFFTVVAFVIGHPGLSTSQFLTGDGTSLIYVNDFIQAAGTLGGGAQWFAPTWSLGVEEQFYLLWPILLVLVLSRSDRSRISNWIVVATLAAAMLYPAIAGQVGAGWMYYSPLGSLLPLLAGCGAAFSRRRPSAILAGAAAALLVVTMLEAPWVTDLSLWHGYVQCATLGATVVILFLTRAEGWAPMRWAPLVWLGRRSYGVYLIHMPVFYAYLILLPDRNPWSYALLVSITSVILAALLYRLVEAPFLAMKTRLTRADNAAATAGRSPTRTHTRRFVAERV
jgi:peptidoglycan/LPS O-acetylase OafA/YrhL